jgi:hypothetical protein
MSQPVCNVEGGDASDGQLEKTAKTTKKMSVNSLADVRHHDRLLLAIFRRLLPLPATSKTAMTTTTDESEDENEKDEKNSE